MRDFFEWVFPDKALPRLILNAACRFAAWYFVGILLLGTFVPKHFFDISCGAVVFALAVVLLYSLVMISLQVFSIAVATKDGNLGRTGLSWLSSLAVAFMAVGSVFIKLPMVADKRTVMLLKDAGFELPIHLKTYTGIRIAVVAIGFFIVHSYGGALLATVLGACGWGTCNYFLAKFNELRSPKKAGA